MTSGRLDVNRRGRTRILRWERPTEAGAAHRQVFAGDGAQVCGYGQWES